MTAWPLIVLLAIPLFAASTTVNVRLRDARVEMSLERYVAAALAGESSVFQSAEALKAMAVAARTYAVRLRGRHSADGFDFCDNTHCQRLDTDAVTPRLESIASATLGELLWFEGKPAFTPYTRDCGGRTQDAGALWPDLAAAYLASHEDSWCTRAGTSPWQWSADPRQLADALRRAGLRSPQLPDRITIVERTSSGRARTLVLAGGAESVRISASSFRFAIGRELGWNTLRSDRYEIGAAGGRVLFEGIGAGHGVGLCQRGAEQMGLDGRGYREILAYYYPGTVPGLSGRGLNWQRFTGESVSLLTTRPDRDRTVLASAERLVRALSQRTRWPIPANIEIRVYPDLDSFRHATGEPGWVAAYTDGRRIHLQPLRDAPDKVLAHELLHCLIESQAAPGLPLWFREGLAGYLERPGPAAARAPADADLRQTSDRARARRTYAESRAAVSGFMNRYGEAAVLGWVKDGLPPEVTKANSSPAATKNK